MVKPDKAGLVTGTTLKTTGPVLVDSRSELHRYAIDGIYVDTVAESGKSPVSNTRFLQPDFGELKMNRLTRDGTADLTPRDQF